jgi:DMSO reductase anchor subunit
MAGSGEPLVMAREVTLIAGVGQRVWRLPAVANFALGGLGAGFYAAAAATGGAALAVAAWLAPALVLGGFVAVAAEAGRPRRGPRVLARVRTSWMSREALLGGAFAALAAADMAAPAPALRALAVAAALAYVFAQGRILSAARGVTAWSVPVMPAVFLASAAVSGLGLLLVADVLGGRPPGGALLGLTLLALVVALGIWLVYLTWRQDAAFAHAVRALADGRAAVAIVAGGYVAPFALAAVALAADVPRLALGAGVLMVLGQALAKWVLIMGAGELRAITLGHLRLQRRVS